MLTDKEIGERIKKVRKRNGYTQEELSEKLLIGDRIKISRIENGKQSMTANELIKSGCPKPKYIDIDVNPNPKYKSNEVYATAKGWVESMGFDVRFKTLGAMATCAADWLVKS